jgi:hypothetical protein
MLTLPKPRKNSLTIMMGRLFLSLSIQLSLPLSYSSYHHNRKVVIMTALAPNNNERINLTTTGPIDEIDMNEDILCSWHRARLVQRWGRKRKHRKAGCRVLQ